MNVKTKNRWFPAWRRGAFATLAVTSILGITSLLSGAPAFSAPEDEPQNPYASSVINKVYDGTGFSEAGESTKSSSFVNSENGYFPGDNGPDDGYVSSNDYVGYEWETRVDAGPARSIEVKLEIPEYLEFDKGDNGTFCVAAGGIEGVYNNNPEAPGCTYEVKAGQSFSVSVNVLLRAKDTAGTVKENQVLKASSGIQGQGVYATDSAQPVAVISAPAADLLIRPAQCSLRGSCSSLSSGTMSSSFIIWPEVLKYKGYDNSKGATTAVPWTAELDVSEMPEGTTYVAYVSENPDNPNEKTAYPLTPVNGVLSLPSTTGEMELNYTVPDDKWGGEEFEESETREFPVHLIVPDTAFQTESYKNNGDGWEPGQGEPSGFSTANNRGTGSRAGYYYANNDWTMVRVYKQHTPIYPEWKPYNLPMFIKMIDRPWANGETLWEPGNTSFSGGGYVQTLSPTTNDQYRRVTQGTELNSKLVLYPSRYGPKEEEGDTSPLGTVVMMDSWDRDEIQLIGDPFLDPSLVEAPSDGLSYKIQWSPLAITAEDGLDPGKDDGWFDTSLANSGSMSKVRSVRVVIENLPLGEHADALSQLTLVIPQKVVKEDPESADDTSVYRDTMDAVVKVEDDEDESPYKLGNRVISINKPTPTVGLSGNVTLPGGAGTLVPTGKPQDIEYKYTPTVSGLVKTTDLIDGKMTVELDPCLINIELTGTDWELVGEPEYGSGCMTDSGTTGEFIAQIKDWAPGRNYNNYTDTATLPPLTFTGTTNPLVINMREEGEGIQVTGQWEVTEIKGADEEAQERPTPEDPSNWVTLEVLVDDFGLKNAELEGLTPKVEVGDPMKFSAYVVNRPLGELSGDAEAIVVLPSRGDNDGYLTTLEEATGNTTYRDEGNPTESDFSGSYTVLALPPLSGHVSYAACWSLGFWFDCCIS